MFLARVPICTDRFVDMFSVSNASLVCFGVEVFSVLKILDAFLIFFDDNLRVETRCAETALFFPSP